MKRTKLLEIIKKSEYNVASAAKVLGFHKSTLNNHVNGNADLGTKKAMKLAALLKITLDDIYDNGSTPTI
jgi:DNA-binding XRE family transcriptional regulator